MPIARVTKAIALILIDEHQLELSDLSTNILEIQPWRTAFLAGLRDRSPANISFQTMALARQNLSADEILSVSVKRCVYDGKFLNGYWIDSKLRKMNMIQRDLFWSANILKDGELYTEIKALIDWVWNTECSNLEPEIRLKTSLVLSWSLTSSHREIRDLATKTLVRLFASDILLCITMLNGFSKIDDLYVLERLYAAAYGAVMQHPPASKVSTLADTVYESMFKKGAPPKNLLLRDHAKGVLQYAGAIGVFDYERFESYITGPYNTREAISYVPIGWTPDYQNEENNYRDSVEFSVFDMGDFGKYVARPFLTKWSPSDRDSETLPTYRDIYNNWVEQFSASCSTHELEAFNDLQRINERIFPVSSFSTDLTEWEDELMRFKNLISNQQYLEFEKNAQEFLEKIRFNATKASSPAKFDVELGQRWIWRRVTDMGWTPDRFFELERGLGGGRRDHRRERLGKKYQWLAFYELGAHLEDNNAYIGHHWDTKESCAFPSLIEADWLRNIDPSLLRTSTNYDGWRRWPETWWTPHSLDLPILSREEQAKWVWNEANKAVGSNLLDLVDPLDGSSWLLLSSFVCSSHKHDDPDNGLDTWGRIRCFVVPKKDATSVLKILKEQVLTSPDDPISTHVAYRAYLGEIHWHPFLSETGIKREPFNYTSIPELRDTTVEYICETSGYDYSIDSSVKVQIPAPWLAQLCGSQLSEGNRLTYTDDKESVVFKDPSADAEGPSACLVKKDIFLEKLDKAGLVPFWVQAGEKRADLNDGFAGCQLFSRIYTIKKNKWTMTETVRSEKPTSEQLIKFFGERR